MFENKTEALAILAAILKDPEVPQYADYRVPLWAFSNGMWCSRIEGSAKSVNFHTLPRDVSRTLQSNLNHLTDLGHLGVKNVNSHPNDIAYIDLGIDPISGKPSVAVYSQTHVQPDAGYDHFSGRFTKHDKEFIEARGPNNELKHARVGNGCYYNVEGELQTLTQADVEKIYDHLETSAANAGVRFFADAREAFLLSYEAKMVVQAATALSDEASDEASAPETALATPVDAKPETSFSRVPAAIFSKQRPTFRERALKRT